MSTIALDTRPRMDDQKPSRGAAAPTHARSGDALSSLQLVTRAQRGDEDARNALCARYLPRLRRWAHGRLPKSFDGVLSTEDIVQETLIRVLSNLHTFEFTHDGSFQAYLSQALRNRIFDERRKASRRPIPDELDDQRQSFDRSPLEQAMSAEDIARYEKALAKLSPLDHAVVVMRVEWGFSFKDAARDLGLPSAGAAQMRLRRALVRIAQDMSHDRAH